MQISQEDLDELEFSILLEEIAPFAYAPQVAEHIRNIAPMPQPIAERELRKTAEFLTSFESQNAIPFNEYEAISEELKVIGIENFRLDNAAFLRIKSLTEQIGRLQKYFPPMAETFPILAEEVALLSFRKEIITLIDKVFNRFGEVKNEASEALKTHREQIQRARKAIDDNFRKAMTTHADVLEDIRETIIDDQRVLAVKSGFKKRVRGRVLGISKTGSITLFSQKA